MTSKFYKKWKTEKVAKFINNYHNELDEFRTLDP